MTKIQFLIALNQRLSGLPQQDVEEHLNFYSEIIEDRMEEGLGEAEAVAAVGSVDDIASQILSEVPLITIAREKVKPKRPMKVWEIVLLAVGFPIWGSLLIAAFAVVVSVYAVLWSIVIALWSVFAALIGCGIGGAAAGIVFLCTGHGTPGIALIGAALVCLGLGIFWFYGILGATKGLVALTGHCILGIKKSLTKKEAES